MRSLNERLVPHTLQCMEIWGGSHDAENSVSTPGLDLWVYSRPYREASAGGDVHYVSLCGGGIITRFILADVAGHGMVVADVARELRTLMRKNINRKSQARLIGELNRQFTEMNQAGRFATAVVATYLATTRELTICNAGHPRPLFYRADQENWSILSGRGGEGRNSQSAAWDRWPGRGRPDVSLVETHGRKATALVAARKDRRLCQSLRLEASVTFVVPPTPAPGESLHRG